MMLWTDDQGTVYDKTTQITDHQVTEKTLEGEGRLSLLILSAAATGKDRTFTCRVTVGEEMGKLEVTIPLKTFTVRTVEAGVSLGQTATLTCSVTDPTDTLIISWYLYGEEDTEDNLKLTTSGSTTVSELVIEGPKNDATYTCQVSGQNTYTFDVNLVVNDIALNPEGQVRAFIGTVVTLTCSFKTATLTEGSFSWLHNGQSCNTYCKNAEDSPKSSSLEVVVEDNTAGEWKCSFTKEHSHSLIVSSPLNLVDVSLNGTQIPTEVWGRPGDTNTVTCIVPLGLNYSGLSVLQWTLNNQPIYERLGSTDGKGTFSFTFGEKIESMTNLTWPITFKHSRDTKGTLQCRAIYLTGEKLIIPSSRINLMTLRSDVKFITLTPNSEAEVTFITLTKVRPTTTLMFPNGTYSRQFAQEKTEINGGVTLKEKIRFSIKQPPSIDRKELALQTHQYNYKVILGDMGELSLTGKVFFVGQTFMDTSTLWGAIGGRIKITAYFTALDTSSVNTTWEQSSNEESGEWVDVRSDGPATLISELDERNVMSTMLLINRLRESDMGIYRAKIEIAGALETTPSVEMKAVYATLQEVEPVFETENVSLAAAIYGPNEPMTITLVHKIAGKRYQLNKTDVRAASPLQISHLMIKVYSSNEGTYYFDFQFESGLVVVTNTVELVIKKRCRPLTVPANTVLSIVDIPGSNNYKVRVKCKESDQHDFVIMFDDQTEAVCDTSTGTYDTTFITPCARTIPPID